MANGSDSGQTSGNQTSFEEYLYQEAVHQNEVMVEIDNAIQHEPSLTPAQRSKLENLSNTVHDHLTRDDFSGTAADLQGKPIPKPGGGYWNHEAEMRASYRSIRKITNSLTEMLKNPNLSGHVRTLLENAQRVAQTEKNMIENLFSQYGGGLE